MKKSKTTEQFVREANEIHHDKYDYSKVEYTNSKTKVCIICPEHGEFWQEANSHLNGSGCPKCAKIQHSYNNVELFINESVKLHGDKYDYSIVDFSRKNDRIEIICPIHGLFETTPHIHLLGCGCPKCAGIAKLSNEEFIEKSKSIHGNKYDYDKVDYKNNRTKVCIICPEHGEFWQTPSSHLKGSGCPKCCSNFKLTKETFIKKAREIHGDKYDYSKVDYKNTKTKVCIICPEHGEFWMTPNSHLLNQGCPKCGDIATGNKLRLSYDSFVKRANIIHNNRYDYSKVNYITIDTDVEIICPEHGEFWQTPHRHLFGQGCPKCKERKLEKEVRESLEKHDIKYIFQASKKDIKWIDNLRLDFYLPDYKIAIECQGEQHFIPVDFAGRGIEWAKKQLKANQKRDKKKYNICKENNIELLYYTNFKRKNMFNQLNKLIECIITKRNLQNSQIVRE